jgi:serine/threonine protein kinase
LQLAQLHRFLHYPLMLVTSIAHYKITAKLGQGGMGEVYHATDTKPDREVAIRAFQYGL